MKTQNLTNTVNRNRNAFLTVEHHQYIRQCVWIHIMESTVQDFPSFLFCLWKLLLFPVNLATLAWGLCCEPTHSHCSLDGVFCLHTQMRLIFKFFFLAFLILFFPPRPHFQENWWCRSRTLGEYSWCWGRNRFLFFALSHRQGHY